MLDIRKGQYFKSQNNQEYIFLSYKNPNIIFCVDDDFEKTGEVLLFDVDVIQEPLEKYNDKAKKINWYYQCKEELDNADIKDKLDTLVNNISNNFKTWEKEVGFLKLDIRIKKISDLVKAKAYYKEQDQYYEIIGFLVETETYEKGKLTEENKGIFSIYHSKCDDLAPMTFFYNDNKDNNKFYNKGTNDYCVVEETLLKEKEIKKYITEHNYNVPVLSDKEDLGMGK